MGVGNVPNPPVSGQPVASAWGNEVSVRILQAYANKAALDAQWNDAPEGAEAVTLDNLRVYQRRQGRWAPPVWVPLGARVTTSDDSASTITTPGGWMVEKTFGPFLLLTNRLFTISWSARWEKKATSIPPDIIGGDVVAIGTGDDVPVESGGVGQQCLVFGQTITGVGAAWRGSVTGLFHTKGSAGGPAGEELPVTIRHSIIAGGNRQWEVSMRRVAIVDIGPWP
jgi:hypothetical protein